MNYQTIIFLLISLAAYVACEKNKKPAVEQQTAPAQPEFSYHIQFDQYLPGESFAVVSIDTTVYDQKLALDLYNQYRTDCEVFANRESELVYSVYEHFYYKGKKTGPDSVERLKKIYPPYRER